MRKIVIATTALVLISSAVFPQSQLDAYKNVQPDLSGTARYLGMGGAFGALGGDISAMSTNPAGLAVYRSSEFVTTLSVNSASAKTNWLTNSSSESRTRLNFDNIAYVGYFPTSNDEGIIGWNVGFSYNRLKNYQRNYSMFNTGQQDYSMSEYMAERAYGLGAGTLEIPGSGSGSSYYPWSNVDDWLSVLGYNAGVFHEYSDKNDQYYSVFSEDSGEPYPLDYSELKVTERGAIDQYNFAFGMNISDIVMLGATFAVTDIRYRYYSYYGEDFANKNYMELENWLETDGTGLGFNVGAIVRPVDYLRLGVAYNSPTWYKMTDYFDGVAATSADYWADDLEQWTPEGGYSEYEFRTPDKWIFSAAAILGQTALISVDYELINYKNMKMYDRNGIEKQYTNMDIRNGFGTTGNLKIGAEVKVTPQFAVRAGAAWMGNPMKDNLKDATETVYTVGTIPHYTVEKGITNYTIGLGYRFTPQFYMDLACVLKHQKEDLYAFSNLFYDNGDKLIDSPKATLKTNTTRVALTLGYKF